MRKVDSLVVGQADGEGQEGVRPPELLRRYRAFARLGRGGMADIFLAIAEGTAGVGKVVVIKRMRADVGSENEERFRSMFFDEARLTTQLNHPCIVQMYEAGEEQGNLFMVMEYLEGHTLQALNRVGRKQNDLLSPAQVCRVMIEVLSGLHYAHEMRDYSGEPLNIVHRDVSPQNIMVGYDGRVRLLDFGIAKGALQTSQTEAGILKGKVRYMAPEQVSSTTTVDRRADVFSVGVVLWELITGARLFPAENDLSSLLSLVNLNLPAPKASSALPTIDPALEALLAKALEKLPENRFATALEMKQALEAYLRDTQQNVELEDVGAYVNRHFAEQRKRLGLRISSELKSAHSNPDSRIRSIARLDMLTDLDQLSSTPSLTSSPPPSGSVRNQQVEELPPPSGTVASAPNRRRALWPVPLFLLVLALGGLAAFFALRRSFTDGGRVASPEQTAAATAPASQAPLAPTASVPVDPSSVAPQRRAE
ncbi:MAG: serine/threonine protein kinase, partial [Polyangiaceae bacterium]|nr:serine/threonine protein kinase [Polyangiaceae bacterium]